MSDSKVRYSMLSTKISYADAVNSKLPNTGVTCGFVCRHTRKHCAYAGCFCVFVAPMAKDEGNEYVSKDGELYFCAIHNPVMSARYNEHKKTVNWYPPNSNSHEHISTEYMIYAIPVALRLRAEYSALLHTTSTEAEGHRGFERLLREQLDWIISITGWARGEEYLTDLENRIAGGYIPSVMRETEPINWDDVDPNW